MKTKIVLLSIVLAFAAATVKAQDYKSAIGGKVGYGLVASYKTFLSSRDAVDLFGGIHWGGVALGAYWERHNEISSINNLYWYYGAGGSYTTWSYGYIGYDRYYEIGLSGVLGLDYKFESVPLNVSLDWAPTIVVLDSWDYPGAKINRFRGGYGALSIRYILK